MLWDSMVSDSPGTEKYIKKAPPLQQTKPQGRPPRFSEKGWATRRTLRTEGCGTRKRFKQTGVGHPPTCPSKAVADRVSAADKDLNQTTFGSSRASHEQTHPTPAL